MLNKTKSVLTISAEVENFDGKSESNENTEGKRGAAIEGMSPAKIFSKKLKHEKIGYMKMNSVLGEEAARLEHGAEVTYRKKKDKNEVLNEKLSTWMISEIQENEMNKTAIGKLSASNALHTSSFNMVPLTGATNSALIVNFDSLSSPGDLSVKRILPFDEFFNVIQSYGDNNGQDYSNNRKSVDAAQSEGFPKEKPPLLAEDCSEQYDHSITKKPAENVVQFLQKTDEQFNAYLKISEGEQLSSKLLSRLSSNLAKPKKTRRIIPLGREAMALTDSRGRASKIATKGFPNIFQEDEANVVTRDIDKIEKDIAGRLLSQGTRIFQIDTISLFFLNLGY
jgi:hypothetical protein